MSFQMDQAEIYPNSPTPTSPVTSPLRKIIPGTYPSAVESRMLAKAKSIDRLSYESQPSKKIIERSKADIDRTVDRLHSYKKGKTKTNIDSNIELHAKFNKPKNMFGLTRSMSKKNFVAPNKPEKSQVSIKIHNKKDEAEILAIIKGGEYN